MPLPRLPDDVWARVTVLARAADAPALAAAVGGGAATARGRAFAARARGVAGVCGAPAPAPAPRPGYYARGGLSGDGRWAVEVSVRCCADCNPGVPFAAGGSVAAVAEAWEVGGRRRRALPLWFDVQWEAGQRVELRWLRRREVCVVVAVAAGAPAATQVHTLRLDDSRDGVALQRVESAYSFVDVPPVDVFSDDVEEAAAAAAAAASGAAAAPAPEPHGVLPQLVRVRRDRYAPLPDWDPEADWGGGGSEGGWESGGSNIEKEDGWESGESGGGGEGWRAVDERLASLRTEDVAVRGSDDEAGPRSTGALAMLAGVSPNARAGAHARQSSMLSTVSAVSDGDDGIVDDWTPTPEAGRPALSTPRLSREQQPPRDRRRRWRRRRKNCRATTPAAVAFAADGGVVASFTRTVVVDARVSLARPMRIQVSMDSRVLLVADLGSDHVRTYAVQDGAHGGPCECDGVGGGGVSGGDHGVGSDNLWRCRCGSDAGAGVLAERTVPMATIPSKCGNSLCFLSPCGSYVAVVTSVFRSRNLAAGCVEWLSITIHESGSSSPLYPAATFTMPLTGDLRMPSLRSLGVTSAPVRGGYFDAFFTDASDGGDDRRCDAFVVPILDEELPVVIRVRTGEVLCSPPMGPRTIEALAESRRQPQTVFSLNESLLLTVYSPEASIGSVRVFDCVADDKLVGTVDIPGMHRWRCEAHPAGYVYVENSCFCCPTAVLTPTLTVKGA